MKMCKVKNCDRKVRGKSELCGAHNTRLRKYGDVYADVHIGRKGGRKPLWVRREMLKYPFNYKYCKVCKKGKPDNTFYKKGVCKACRREKFLQKKYNISVEDYNKILRRQKKGCALCRIKKPGGRGEFFAVDHNHKTGVIRGLLCSNCNGSLGKIEKIGISLYVGRLNQYLKRDVNKYLKKGG